MKRITILAALVVAMFTGVALSPGKAIADGCAASGFALVQDAQACGGDWYVLAEGCIGYNTYRTCYHRHHPVATYCVDEYRNGC